MAFNIVDLVKDQISDQLLGQMGNVLGTDGSKTSAALGGALPGLLTGLTGAASKPEGASVLYDAARDQDDGVLGNMGALLGGGDDTSRVIEQGNSLLGSLLGGDAVGKLGGVLANFAGISRSGSGSLMGMLAPIVIGAIKRKMTESNLDAGGLSRLLDEQRPNVDAAMPQGLASQLQSEGFFDSISPATAPITAAPTAASAPAPAAARPTASAPAAEPASTGGGPMRWLLPLAAVVVLGLVAWLFLGGQDADEVPDAAVAPAVVLTPEEMEAATAVDLPEGVDLDRITGAVDGVFDDTTAALDGISDEASARAALPSLKEANATLGGLNDVITRLPEAARAPVTAAVSNGLANLRPIADRILGMPAVGPVVEPVLAPMLKTLDGLAG